MSVSSENKARRPSLPDSFWARPNPHRHPSQGRMGNREGHPSSRRRNSTSIAGSWENSWKGSSQDPPLQSQKKSGDTQQLLCWNPEGPPFRLHQNQPRWNAGPNRSGTSCLAARSALWPCRLEDEESNDSFQGVRDPVDEAKPGQDHHPNPSPQGLGAGNLDASRTFLTRAESCPAEWNSTGICLAWPGLQRCAYRHAMARRTTQCPCFHLHSNLPW